jgi:hypothetical protein
MVESVQSQICQYGPDCFGNHRGCFFLSFSPEFLHVVMPGSFILGLFSLFFNAKAERLLFPVKKERYA